MGEDCNLTGNPVALFVQGFLGCAIFLVLVIKVLPIGAALCLLC